MLYKLTDTHLSLVAQCFMKVSLAAQVMSLTVAPNTVLYADKCTTLLVGNQYSALYSLAS